MNGQTDSYLSYTANPEIGKYLLDPRPSWLWSEDGDAIVWANAAGAVAFRVRSMADLLARRFPSASPARTHISRVASSQGGATVEVLRFFLGVRSISFTCICRKLEIDGHVFVLAVGTEPLQQMAGPIDERAEIFVDLIAACKGYAAVLDEQGDILGAAGDQENLTPAADAIDKLVADAEDSESALLQNPVETPLGHRAAGIARIIADDLPLNVLIVGEAPVDAPPVPEPVGESPIDEDEPVEDVSAEDADDFVFERRDKADRFTWSMDANGVLTRVSPELERAVGQTARSVVGMDWGDMREQLGIDTDGVIATAIENHDTFTRRRIDWPVHGRDITVPVDLTALPSFGRDREFAGYLGFGVCHTSEAGPAVTIVDFPDQSSPVAEPSMSSSPADGDVDDDTGLPMTSAGIVVTHAFGRPPVDDEIKMREEADDPASRGFTDDVSAPRKDEENVVGDRRSDAEPPDVDSADDEDSENDNVIDIGTSPALATGGRDERSDDVELAEPDDEDGARQDEADGSRGQDEGDLPDDIGSPDELARLGARADTGRSGHTETVTPQGDVERPLKSTAVGPEPSDGSSGLFDDYAARSAIEGDDDDATSATFDLRDDADDDGRDATKLEDDETPSEAGDASATADDAASDDSFDQHPKSIGLGGAEIHEERADADIEKADLSDADEASDQAESEMAKTNGERDGVDVIPGHDGPGEDKHDGEQPRLKIVDNEDGSPVVRLVGGRRLSGQEHRNFREIADQLNARFEDDPTAEHAGNTADENPRDIAEDQSASAEPAQIPAPPVITDHRILDRLPLGLLIYRGEDVLFANRAFLDIFGYPSASALSAAGGLDALFPNVEAFVDDTLPGPLKAERVDGSTIDVTARLQTVPWEGETACLLSVRTAEQPSDAEPGGIVDVPFAPIDGDTSQGLAARVAELEAILDTATEGVVILDKNANVLAINKSAEALFGYDTDEIVGRQMVDLLAEESHRSALDYLDGLSRNGVASVLNDGREVIGKVAQGGLIPLFMTIGPVGGTKDKFCAVLRDITQWKKAEEELVEAKRVAETANSQKSDFLAKISHEIRTPLNGIIGFSEVMMEERFGPIGNDRYRGYLADIHMSGAHLMSLLNDLLDLSKIEAGKLEMEFSSVDLNDVVQQCVAILQPQANRERIIIRTSLPQAVPNVVADKRTLRQIVLNLMSNAIKFTEPGGQVIVSSSLEESGEVVFRVRDTGVGMSDTDIQTALEPFRQITTTTRVHADGTGLGLPLTKALVEANRASFAIESERDHGTLIRVTFPSQRVLAE